MIITQVDVYGYDLHYAHGEYVMSKGRAATTQPGTVVRLRTADGVDGWGEITPLGGTYLPVSAAGARSDLAELAPHLLGVDACAPSAVRRAMDGVLLGGDYAKSADRHRLLGHPRPIPGRADRDVARRCPAGLLPAVRGGAAGRAGSDGGLHLPASSAKVSNGSNSRSAASRRTDVRADQGSGGRRPDPTRWWLPTPTADGACWAPGSRCGRCRTCRC